MAINLNVATYGAQFNAFAEFAAAHKNQDWVVRIEGQGRQPGGQGLLGPNGEPRNIVAKTLDGAGNILRFSGSRAVNNDVRQLFKETVLAVCGVRTMEELPPSVLAVMKKDDYDGKGHPLTVRRIKAVTNAIKDAARIDEAHSAIEKAGCEKPVYIMGMANESQEKFMSFYSAKLDGFAENGGPSKKDFDYVLSTLFNRIRGVMRSTLVELLASGKIAIPVVDGKLPEGKELSKFDADVKTILKSIKDIGGHNETLFDIAINTVKAADGTLAPADVDFSDEDFDLYDLREAAAGVDISGLLSAGGDAESLGRQLVEFKEKVHAEFDRKFPDAHAKCSATKLAIIKNVFMHYAIMQPGIKSAEFSGLVSELRKNHGELAQKTGVRELLDLIVPSIETSSNQTIAKDLR